MFERKIEIHRDEAFEGLEAARQYAEAAQKSTRRYMAFLERLEALSIEGRYLDVGAGPGILTSLVAEKFPWVEITALELSEAMVSMGQDYITHHGLEGQINFVTGDAADEEFIQSLGKFDLIFSTYTLHHWEHPRKVIDNLVTMLADDGLLFLYDLRRVWWMYWVPVNNGFFKSIRGAYVQSEIEELLQDIPSECYDIKHEFPFMVSVFIRRPVS
ncbi:MAG: Trans-aconitate 2-methyltransferase [Anaerolineae bacterium]|nr:Trans-aconitate 2-methyltransferase [Anaerolineae bacterium]